MLRFTQIIKSRKVDWVEKGENEKDCPDLFAEMIE
jgi:hypothetical protein